ncbi:amidase family protein [Corynebacterium macginleyi]|uniref:amidase family protein n=1 Tax=Corynebacterium macginleyi TaxID=38290 RepID=UPI00217D307B|nr:amidase family protein [Corynebacterium macginleyi]
MNPRDPQVCGGGSSSGSAALIACEALDLTVGSDNAGSGQDIIHHRCLCVANQR